MSELTLYEQSLLFTIDTLVAERDALKGRVLALEAQLEREVVTSKARDEHNIAQAQSFRTERDVLKAEVADHRQALLVAHAENARLLAEVARLKDPDTLRNVNARENIERIKNLNDALDEALSLDGEGSEWTKRCRAIAAGRQP